MKKIVYILIALTSIMIGCRWQEVDDQSDRSISIDPQTQDADVSTKAGETLFVDGDKLGLYVVKSGQDLTPRGNAVDNALFVASDGKIVGTPPVYYPDRKASVNFYSYYPYQPGLANALEVFFGIHTDQADFSSYRASDFCYGSKLNVAPTVAAEPIVYAHKLSRVAVRLTLPVSIGGKPIAQVEGVTLLGLADSATINLSTGVVINRSHRADVGMYPQAATTFAAIVPAQSLEGGALARIRLKFDDSSTSDYVLNVASGLTIAAGATNNFAVTVNDNGVVALADDPTISSWVTIDTEAVVSEPISNNFTVLWLLPHPKYGTASSVVLSIFDQKSGLTRDFKTSKFQLLADRSSSKLAAFCFDLQLPLASGVSYSYQIKAISFLNAGEDTIQRCDALVAANVTRSGAYTLGIEQSNLLHIVDGTVHGWDEVSGVGGIGGGVSNTFKIQFIEPQYDFVTLLGRIKLRIDGADYLFSPVTSSGNALLQNSTKFSFPDLNGKVPPIYPYVVEQIVMQRADGSEIQALDASVQVSRGGDVTLQVFRGFVVKLGSITVGGYGSAVESGDVEYRGPVLSNKFSVVYCSGEAVDATSCLKVKKLKLTINKTTKIELGDYTMEGSRFSASSELPIDITASIDAPKTYPYTITGIELIDQSGGVMESVTLTDPIKVLCGGDVVIRVMK